MSEIIGNEVDLETAPLLEEGQPQEVVDVVENLSDAEIELLPVDEYGDKYVSVQVGGEEKDAKREGEAQEN